MKKSIFLKGLCIILTIGLVLSADSGYVWAIARTDGGEYGPGVEGDPNIYQDGGNGFMMKSLPTMPPAVPGNHKRNQDVVDQKNAMRLVLPHPYGDDMMLLVPRNLPYGDDIMPEIGPPPKREPSKFNRPEPPEIGPIEIGPPEIGPIEIDATQIGPPKIEPPMIEPKIKIEPKRKPPKISISPPTLNHPFTEKNSKDERIVVELPSGAASMWAWRPLSEVLKSLPHVLVAEVTRVKTFRKNKGNETLQYTDFHLTILEELKGELTSKKIILRRLDGKVLDGRLQKGPSDSTGGIYFEEGKTYLMTFYRDASGKLTLNLYPHAIVEVEGPGSPEVAHWRELIG